VIPIASDTLLVELESIQTIVNKWVNRVASGIPGQDTLPTGTDAGISLDVWVTELVGELRLLSGKTENIALVISSLYE
jgi:hypothetical protein